MSSDAELAIVVNGLCKSFDSTRVLDRVDLNVQAGTVYALLGPNGAGKTTIVRILSTLISADAGEVRVAGHDISREANAVRALIGVTGQFSAVDELSTGEENLRLMADLNHLARAERTQRVAELLERFDLLDAAHRSVSTYSGGMRRRLDLAMTLVGSPQVIFLDEPTTGLDPRSRQLMWEDIRELVAGGVTILLTTQYLDEADQLADRIAVLDQGRIVAEGTPEELKRQIPGGHVRLRFATSADFDLAVARIETTAQDDERLYIDVANDGGVPALRALLDQLDDAGVEVDHLSIHTPDLDDVFFAVTGHPTPEEVPAS
jgi:ABC-2 type transport system ATP-binding protein